jgi:branched-chain amino acid transport system ATP-binding protein
MRDAVAGKACLSIEGLTKRFGGFFAVNDLSMEVADGSIHALIGPNGAGKTTFFNLVTGVLPADRGTITLKGEPIDDPRPSRRTFKGIARTFQNIRLFPQLTVLETVMIGEHCRAYPSVWSALGKALLHRPFTEASEERQMRSSAIELLEFLGLGGKEELRASDLPYGEQRKLEMARALATRPQLLLLDEPAAGMNPRETEELDEIITRIRDRGVTIVLVAGKWAALQPLGALFRLRKKKPAVEAAKSLLSDFGLGAKADWRAGSLSYGEARRLEIARALYGRPQVLLLDEPAAGMNEAETERLVNDIRKAQDRLRAVVLIEHDMSLIRALSTRLIAMDYGRKIAEGDPVAVLAHPQVQQAYLGDAP